MSSAALPFGFYEPALYHNSQKFGFFALLNKDKNGRLLQKVCKLSLLQDIHRIIDPTTDTYISQAEFAKPNRRIVNLARICLNFVDIDYYTQPHLRDLTPDQVCGQILLYCNDNGLPEPSIIIASGRGIYLKWIYDTAIPAQALPRWNAVQKNLVDSFLPFGADTRAKDASRVLRLVNTVNSRTGEIVKVIHPFNSQAPQTYSFEYMAQELFIISRQELLDVQTKRLALKAERAEAIEKRRKQFQLVKGNVENTMGLRRLSPLQLSWDRLHDIRLLAYLRGGVPVGKRDIFLFLATCFVCMHVPYNQLYLEVESLARELAPTLSHAEIHGFTGTAIRRAQAAAEGKKIEYCGVERDPRYFFRNSTLIDWLEITPDEERQLKTIISNTEASERHRKRNRKKSDRPTYLTDIQAELNIRIERFVELSLQGLTVKEIANRMCISRQTVHKLKKLAHCYKS